MNGDMKFRWRSVTSEMPQMYISDPELFIFINELKAETECTLRKFVDYIKLGGEADTSLIVVLLFRGISVGYRNGLTRNLRNLTREKTKCYPYRKIDPCTSTGWGPSDWKGILRVILWGHGEKQADNKLRMQP